MSDAVIMIDGSPVDVLMGGGVGPRGNPGGNVMAIGLFDEAASLSIPLGTDVVRTSGHGRKGLGSAQYVEDAAVDASYVASHPRSAFLSANGRGFRLNEVVVTPLKLGALGNFTTGNRATGVPVFGESATEGSADGILNDDREACETVLALMMEQPSEFLIADFSERLWGLSANENGHGLEINQPPWLPRTFIGGEFRGIGAGTDLIHIESASYSNLAGNWHLRSGADLGSSYGYAARQWENGLWIRGCAMARMGNVKISGFKRWAVDFDPENDPDANNNIGFRIERLYANNNGSAVGRAGNVFQLAFTASARIGVANSDGQRTNLTMAAGHDILRVGDVVRSPAGSYHSIREKAGAVISVYPWMLSEAAAGTIDSCHGGAMNISGKDTAGAGCDHLTSVTNGCGLYLHSQHGTQTGAFIVEGGGLGLIIGVPNGASIGHKIGWMHQEGNELELLALASSQTTIDIGTPLIGEDENPFKFTDVIEANDGVSLNTAVGLPWVTMKANGTYYGSGRNSLSYGNGTKSRAFFPILSNDPSTNRLRKVQAVGQPTAVTLKYREPTDRFNRDSFGATLEIAAPDGGAPGSDITITLDAADAVAGITIDGGAGPYVIPGGTATGPVLLYLWLDTSGATKNWIVIGRAGLPVAPVATLAAEAYQLDNAGGTQRSALFETGANWYWRTGVPLSGAVNGNLHIEGQGVSQPLANIQIRAQSYEFLDDSGVYWVYTGTDGNAYFNRHANLNTGFKYKINSVQVVGARKTGWAVATGTATRTAFDTTTVTVTQLAERVKALIDDLHGSAGHGLIGT